jgi:multicomponent Na+:H+ antiporter subunit E
MTASTTDRREPRVPSRRGGFQPRAILFVAVAWVLLWDRVTWGNLLSGLLVGLAVTFVFPLPSIDFVGRARPLRVTWLVVTFLADLVMASIEVTRLAFSRRPFRNAVIEVPLRTTSDFYLTITAELNALVPGSVVLEARRSTSTIYLHLLDVDGPEDIEAGRAHVYTVETRVVRALGSNDEIAQLERGGGAT